MNPEQMLGYISKVIEHRQPQPGAMYYVGVWGHILDCRLCKKTEMPNAVFPKATGNTLLNGFTNRQWEELLYKVAVHFKCETDILERQKVEDLKCQETRKL